MGGGACSSNNEEMYSKLDVCDLTVDTSITIKKNAPHEDEVSGGINKNYQNPNNGENERRVDSKYMSNAEYFEKIGNNSMQGVKDQRPILFLAFEGTGDNHLNGNQAYRGGHAGQDLMWQNLFVRTVDIGDSAVTNVKIENEAVTTDKIADANVTNGKLDQDMNLFKLNNKQIILNSRHHVGTTFTQSWKEDIVDLQAEVNFAFQINNKIKDFDIPDSNSKHLVIDIYESVDSDKIINGDADTLNITLRPRFQFDIDILEGHYNDPIFFRPFFKFHNSNNTDKYIIDKQATDDNALITRNAENLLPFDYSNDVDGSIHFRKHMNRYWNRINGTHLTETTIHRHYHRNIHWQYGEVKVKHITAAQETNNLDIEGWDGKIRIGVEFFGYNKTESESEIDVFVTSMDVTGEIDSNSTIYKELIVH